MEKLQELRKKAAAERLARIQRAEELAKVNSLVALAKLKAKVTKSNEQCRHSNADSEAAI